MLVKIPVTIATKKIYNTPKFCASLYNAKLPIYATSTAYDKFIISLIFFPFKNIIVGNNHNIYQELKFVININVNIYNNGLYSLIYDENISVLLFNNNLIPVYA